MKVSEKNIIINIACFSIFILISTLYSTLDFLAYAAFILLLLATFLAGRIRYLTLIQFIFSILILSVLLSLLNTVDISLSLISSIYLIFIFMFSLTLSKSVNNLADFERLLFFGLIGYLVLNLRNFTGDFTEVRFSGVVGQPNALGLLSGTGFIIGITYLYLFHQSRKMLKRLVLVVVLSSLFLVLASGSRGAFVSIIVPSLYLFIRNIKSNLKMIIFLLISLSSAFIVFYDKIIDLPLYSRLLVLPAALGLELDSKNFNTDFSSAQDDVRLDIADTAFQAFLNKPILGNGVNTFIHFSDFVYTHNSYLEILFSQGIFGSFIYGLFIIKSFLVSPKNKLYTRLNKTKNFALLYLIVAGFSIPNYQSKSQIIIFSFLLISVSFLNKEKFSK